MFLVVTVGLGWLVCLPLWLSGKGLSDLTFVQLTGQALMFTPLLGTIAALIVQRRRAREPLASIPRRLGLWPLYPVGRVLGGTGLAVLATYLLVLATYLLAGAFGWMRLDLVGLSGFSAQRQALPGLEELPLGAAVAVFLVIVVVNTGATALFAFGEEVGWRGWSLTSPRPLGTWPAPLLIGLVWGLWHAPLILLGYNFGRPDLTGLAFMVGGRIALSVLFGGARLRTGSLWPAVFAHAALNASSGMLARSRPQRRLPRLRTWLSSPSSASPGGSSPPSSSPSSSSPGSSGGDRRSTSSRLVGTRHPPRNESAGRRAYEISPPEH